MVTRKEKIRQLKVIRFLAERGELVLPAGNEELETKIKGIAGWVKNFPPTKAQLEAASAAYLALAPALRHQGDLMRELLILSARRKNAI